MKWLICLILGHDDLIRYSPAIGHNYLSCRRCGRAKVFPAERIERI